MLNTLFFIPRYRKEVDIVGHLSGHMVRLVPALLLALTSEEVHVRGVGTEVEHASVPLEHRAQNAAI